MELKFRKITMPTDEIKITSEFSQSMPKLSKLLACADFYRANGYFDRQIIIDDGKYLRDGYCAYLTAKLFGIGEVETLMVSAVEEQGKPTLDSKPSTVKVTETQQQFHPGMLVKITGNVTDDHNFEIGTTVRLVEKNGRTAWKAEYLDEHDWWYVKECNMEQIERAEDKPTNKPTDSHKFTYNVGDRVTSGGHPGQVIGIYTGYAPIGYLVDFDEPGVGLHNGEAIGVTVGKCGTSNNCLWRWDNGLQPIENDPEPLKLYCIKDHARWLTKGKIYDFDGRIVCYDDGTSSIWAYESFDDYKRCNSMLAACLVPLVKRTAKVGEWIYVITDNGGFVTAGTIWRVTNVDSERVSLTDMYICSLNNYLVLDGYTDEKE